ncbi:hypothetical protein FVE85_8362 [Porphyridium purpureum]|uniref:Uncharacterized protein n=1 Tax=Porphyridium purpureum TaxID=35688 RepID=A0A5J4YLU0_PORPP|nr:hypothetical protein FVE85_8362 [Porphyridium purpureum]|eukprot:POR6760..scf244_11
MIRTHHRSQQPRRSAPEAHAAAASLAQIYASENIFQLHASARAAFPALYSVTERVPLRAKRSEEGKALMHVALFALEDFLYATLSLVERQLTAPGHPERNALFRDCCEALAKATPNDGSFEGAMLCAESLQVRFGPGLDSAKMSPPADEAFTDSETSAPGSVANAGVWWIRVRDPEAPVASAEFELVGCGIPLTLHADDVGWRIGAVLLQDNNTKLSAAVVSRSRVGVQAELAQEIATLQGAGGTKAAFYASNRSSGKASCIVIEAQQLQVLEAQGDNCYLAPSLATANRYSTWMVLDKSEVQKVRCRASAFDSCSFTLTLMGPDERTPALREFHLKAETAKVRDILILTLHMSCDASRPSPSP